MDLPRKKILSSKISIVGLFAFLCLILTIPLAVLLSQERQTVTSRAQVNPAPLVIKSRQISPSKSSGTISGYVYNDTNKNGERDPQEQPFPGVSIKIAQIKTGQSSGQNLPIIIKSDINGYFRYDFTDIASGSSSFLVSLVLPPNFKTINTNPIIISDLNQNDQGVVQFGLYPLSAVGGKPTSVISGACTPRPACLDSVPQCLLAEPISGWCPKTILNSHLSSPSGKIIKGN